MANLNLTYVGADYLERMRALQDGSVHPEGVDLTYQVENVGKIFHDVAHNVPFEASEMSVSTQTMLLSRGINTMVGIPVFPSRSFRHNQIYVTAKSGIEKPEDMIGKNIAAPNY